MSSATRSRSRGRRALRGVANAMIVIGALLLIDCAITLLWQEPISAFYAHQRQHSLQRKLAALEREPPTPLERHVLVTLPNPERRVAFAARAFDRRTHEGDPLGRIRIPKIGVSAVFVEGTATADLRSGPGHYPGTPLPGEHGTVAIAGHRTTYGAWFRRINDLKPGDGIALTMPYGQFSYRVQRTRIVPPTALWVTNRVGYDQLILSACHPLYSAAKRIVVFARLVDVTPRGVAA